MPSFRSFAVLALLSGLTSVALADGNPAPVAPAPDWGGPYYGHMWGGMGYGWGHGLVWLVFIAIGVLIYLLARRGGDAAHTSHRRDASYSALQILNERYARGEIDKAEYEEKKATLLADQR